MRNPKRLGILTSLAGQREQDAARLLGMSRAALAEREARLGELKAFREDYLDELQVHAEITINALRLKSRHAFLDRLDAGIGQAEHQAADALERCTLREREWLSRHSRCKALDKLMDRQRARRRKAEQRIEQRRLDEFALRRANIRRGRRKQEE